MTSTYNLARMNMFLHGIACRKIRHCVMVIRLDGDWPTGEETDFNMVLMNPPYSAKWSAAAGFLQDERFSDYGVLAPKSKGRLRIFATRFISFEKQWYNGNRTYRMVFCSEARQRGK